MREGPGSGGSTGREGDTGKPPGRAGAGCGGLGCFCTCGERVGTREVRLHEGCFCVKGLRTQGKRICTRGVRLHKGRAPVPGVWVPREVLFARGGEAGKRTRVPQSCRGAVGTLARRMGARSQHAGVSQHRAGSDSRLNGCRLARHGTARHSGHLATGHHGCRLELGGPGHPKAMGYSVGSPSAHRQQDPAWGGN